MTSALDALRAGDLALVPTDTVYGFAALPGSAGYDVIFQLKQRPKAQVLPWLVSDFDMLEQYATDIPEYARTLCQRFWPGALTVVLKASEAALSMGEVAQDGTIAFRAPDNEVCQKLIQQLASPLACTSANLHGEPAVAKRSELPLSFAGIAGFDELPDECSLAMASTIVDCTGPQPVVLRFGPIPSKVVADCV